MTQDLLTQAIKTVPMRRVDRRGEPPRLTLKQSMRLAATGLDRPFNSVVAVRFAGAGQLDVRALASAVEATLHRHEALRWPYALHGGRYTPVVRDTVDGVLAERRATSTEDALRALAESAAHDFDLRTGPFLRLEVVHLPAHEFVLQVSTDHFVADGRSMEIILGDLGRHYSSLVDGSRVGDGDGDLPYQLVDYAHWQAALLGGGYRDRVLDEWAGMGGDRGFDSTGNGSVVTAMAVENSVYRYGFEQGFLPEFRARAGRRRTTPFAQGVEAVLSAIRSDGGPGWVLSPTTGRAGREQQGIVGNFVNLLPFGGVERLDAVSVRDMVAHVTSLQAVPVEVVAEHFAGVAGSYLDLTGLPALFVDYDPTLELAGCGLRHLPVPSTSTLFPHSSFLHLGRASSFELVVDSTKVAESAARAIFASMTADLSAGWDD